MTQEPFYFVIFSALESDMEDSPQFWNNELGWGYLENATVFTERERWTLHLPTGDTEWVKLPKVPNDSI